VKTSKTLTLTEKKGQKKRDHPDPFSPLRTV